LANEFSAGKACGDEDKNVESAVDAEAGDVDDDDDDDAWADTWRKLPKRIADNDEVAAEDEEDEDGLTIREAMDPCRLWRECLAEPTDGMVGTRCADEAPIVGGGGNRGSGVAGRAEVDKGDVDEDDDDDDDDDDGDSGEKRADESRQDEAGGGEAGSGRASGPGWPANEGMPSEIYE
jgi:hypothetical protein